MFQWLCFGHSGVHWPRLIIEKLLAVLMDFWSEKVITTDLFKKVKWTGFYLWIKCFFDFSHSSVHRPRLFWSDNLDGYKNFLAYCFNDYFLVTQVYIDPDSLLRSFLLCLWTWAWKLSKITLHLCGSHYISITRHCL